MKINDLEKKVEYVDKLKSRIVKLENNLEKEKGETTKDSIMLLKV
jgi:flagellin-specific chaperone FliS